MSNLSVVMGKQARFSVDESANLLKRLYYVEREVMRTLGGYLVSVFNWDLKTTLPRHIWEDSLRADALRSRVLELRYPRRDVDDGYDPRLTNFLSALIRCKNDEELVQGVYFVTKTVLCEAYKYYLQATDPLDDAPTIAFMRRFQEDIEQQIKDIKSIYESLEEDNKKDTAWHNCLTAYLGEGKGILGLEAAMDNSLELELETRPPYEPPKVPNKDKSFGSALYHMPPRESNSFIEEQVFKAIQHANEIWAAEVPGLLMWSWVDMPWEFHLDAARWAYDESRHCLMGVERLKSWGFTFGVDVPQVSDNYIGVSEGGELLLLSLLHAFEYEAPPIKEQLRDSFQQGGDLASSQDYDYDWADESIHLFYGTKWLQHRLNGDVDKIEDLKDEAFETYYNWLDIQRKKWDYEPYMSRIEAKIKGIEASQRS